MNSRTMRYLWVALLALFLASMASLLQVTDPPFRTKKVVDETQDASGGTIQLP